MTTSFEIFEKLLLCKKYSELTKEEKNHIAEFCSSEPEYHQMQSMMMQFKADVNTTLKKIEPSYPIYLTIQNSLTQKWMNVSYYLNSIFDSLISCLKIENYALKTAMLAVCMSGILWTSFYSEKVKPTKISGEDMIADSSYKSMPYDSISINGNLLAP